MYIFQRKLLLNKAYRFGINRVGCSICPFASEQAEYVIGKKFPVLSSKYIGIIKEHVNLLGIKDEEKVEKYIAQGKWKGRGRGGGEGVNTNGARLDFISLSSHFQAIMSNPNENFFEWAKTVGMLHYKNYDNKYIGEIRVGNILLGFELEEQIKK